MGKNMLKVVIMNRDMSKLVKEWIRCGSCWELNGSMKLQQVRMYGLGSKVERGTKNTRRGCKGGVNPLCYWRGGEGHTLFDYECHILCVTENRPTMVT